MVGNPPTSVIYGRKPSNVRFIRSETLLRPFYTVGNLLRLFNTVGNSFEGVLHGRNTISRTFRGVAFPLSGNQKFVGVAKTDVLGY